MRRLFAGLPRLRSMTWQHGIGRCELTIGGKHGSTVQVGHPCWVRQIDLSSLSWPAEHYVEQKIVLSRNPRKAHAVADVGHTGNFGCVIDSSQACRHADELRFMPGEDNLRERHSCWSPLQISLMHQALCASPK